MTKMMPGPSIAQKGDPFTCLEQGVYAALETYSNVHRGSGHNSMASTCLYEQARKITLEYLGLDKNNYVVIFCTPRRAVVLRAQLESENYKSVSSHDIGLPIGVTALAVKRKALPKGIPFETGGGTTRIVSSNWVIWAGAPEKFEAGTPAIINVIAFARALRLITQFGNDAFRDAKSEKLSASDILYNDILEKYSGQELLDELRKTLIGLGIRVPTTGGQKPFINLDNAASTPTFKPILNAVCLTWRQPQQVQQEIIQEVKSICAGVLGAPLSHYEVIFTSNTTEAINIAAESLSGEEEQEPVILNTIMEHTSNDLPWRMVPRSSMIRLQVNDEGFVDLKELDGLMCGYNQRCDHGKKRIRLVAVSGASNVLGIFNNLEEISKIVHKYEAHLLVDAAQMVAHRRIDMDQSGIDYLAFSAHKAYAPFGTGALVVRKGLLNFSSSEMNQIISSGEENAGGIAALGKALTLLQRIGLDLIREDEQTLTAKTLRGLSQIKGLQIFGIKDPDSQSFSRKGGVVVFAMKGMMANKIAVELAEQGGIGVRYGCHCAHLMIKKLVNISPFLEKFQYLIATLFPQVRFPGLTRVSIGIENSEKDIDTLIETLNKILLKQQSDSTHKNIKKQMDDFARAAARRVYYDL
jgi:selenocysteine lyase/cysteine desulfurase